MAQRLLQPLRCSCLPSLGRPTPLLNRAPTFSPLHPSAKPALPSRFPSSSRAYSTPRTPPPPPGSGPSPGPRPDPFTAQREAYARARGAHHARRNRSLLLYSASTIILVTTVSYLAVPLYRVFCSATGYGGTPMTDSTRFSADRLVPAPEGERRIRVSFNADSSDSLPWSFTPQQKEVRVLPGETSLAFYTAVNHSDEDIIGIATYNVTPNNVSTRPGGRERGSPPTTASADLILHMRVIDRALLCQSRVLLLRGAADPGRGGG